MQHLLPPYIVFNDKTLIDMCNILPTDKQSMLRVSGVGASKMQKYGERFLNAIHTFLDMHPNEIVSMSVESKDKPFDRAEFNRKRSGKWF